jgi:hypothetical protein
MAGEVLTMAACRRPGRWTPQPTAAAATALNEALAGEWPGFEVEARFPLERIAEAHAAIEGRKVSDG